MHPGRFLKVAADMVVFRNVFSANTAKTVAYASGVGLFVLSDKKAMSVLRIAWRTAVVESKGKRKRKRKRRNTLKYLLHG